MESRISLPFRVAASAPQETPAAYDKPEAPPVAGFAAGSSPGPKHHFTPHALTPNPSACESAAAHLAPDSLAQQQLAAAEATGHQFWLKDSKVAEELFTLYRSAKHLVDFTASIIGGDPTTGTHKPVAVMSDGDVAFMTQLSADIVRSVNGITSIRQHGSRPRKQRRLKHGRPQRSQGSPPLTRESPTHRSRQSRDDTGGSGSRRRQWGSRESADDQLQQCYKCGRRETPEWRKGPDGLLCNSCGLVYIKQKRKEKAAEKGRS